MRDSTLETWERELESEDLLRLGYIIGGLPEGYYQDDDNLQDAMDYAIEEFCKRHHLSKKTEEEMLNCIPVRDAFYKVLEREGWLKHAEKTAKT